MLVDSEPLAAAAMIRFLATYGREPDPSVQPRLLGRRLKEAIAIAKRAYGLPGTEEDLAAEYGRMRVEAIQGNVEPLPGATEILSTVRASGIPTALATSGLREHATVSLQETGLAGQFDAEATGSEVDRGKPAPDLFLLAAERLGLEPSGLLVFEDSPLGVEAARTAGMRVAAVQGSRATPHDFAVAPDISFRDLHEARRWLITRVELGPGASPD